MNKDINPENVQMHCRCCLNKLIGNSNKISELPRTLVKLFRYCTEARTWQKGLYPELICADCYKLLRDFSNFKELCKEASYFLEELLNGKKLRDKKGAENYEKSEQNIEIQQEVKENDPYLNDAAETAAQISSSTLLVPKDESLENLEVKPEISDGSEFVDNSNEESNEHIKSESNLDTKTKDDGIKTQELNTSAAQNNISFENVIVTSKIEDLQTDQHRETDSDFEDSLALTEVLKLAKSNLDKKQKKRGPKSKKNKIDDSAEKPEKAKVICEICNRKFKWPFELRRHIKEVHGDKPIELPCKYDCGKIFHSQNTLKSHYRINHEFKKQVYRENAYICEQCGKGFRRLNLLERHKYHHLPPEARPFKCEQCGKTFAMERIFKEHLLRHSGNKKFECSYCHIKKATLSEYREHINIHTKEKEYACELCPKVFYRSKTLAQHFKAVHQRIKKHFCRYCQHSFANHINLVHHERIHTGEKPYSCEICKRSFIQPSALKTHMKTHDTTRVKAKAGRKPKSSKVNDNVEIHGIIDEDLQINHFNG